MSTSIQTTLTVTNEMDVKLEAIRTLLKAYVPGLQNIMKGILPLGDESIPLPCIMFQPVSIDSQMITTAKTQIWHRFLFVYYVGGDNAEDVALKATDVAEILKKLFSNNALGDIAGANTNRFKNYEPYWIYSEMERIEISPAFKNGRQGGQPRYVAIGTFLLKVQTVKIE